MGFKYMSNSPTIGPIVVRVWTSLCIGRLVGNIARWPRLLATFGGRRPWRLHHGSLTPPRHLAMHSLGSRESAKRGMSEPSEICLSDQGLSGERAVEWTERKPRGGIPVLNGKFPGRETSLDGRGAESLVSRAVGFLSFQALWLQLVGFSRSRYGNDFQTRPPEVRSGFARESRWLTISG